MENVLDRRSCGGIGGRGESVEEMEAEGVIKPTKEAHKQGSSAGFVPCNNIRERYSDHFTFTFIRRASRAPL
jgi:hypothetical protein